MRARETFNIVVAVTVLLISYNLYAPVPAGLRDPWLVGTYIAALRSANFLVYTLELFTTVPSTATVRYLIETVYHPWNLTNENIITEDLKISGINVRLYRPKSSMDPSPCILYFHGGGWTYFSIDSYDAVTSDLAQYTNMVVISVGYRQAPEFTFPVPFEDCLRVTRHVLQNGLQYKINSWRVALVGDSTGAALAAAVSYRISEEDPSHTPHIKLQVLLQPVLQAFNFDTLSYRRYSQNTFMGRQQMIKFWCSYLGIQPSSEVLTSFQRNEHVSPSMRSSIYSHYMSEHQLPETIRERATPSSLDKNSNQYDKELSRQVEAKVIDPYVSPLLADHLENSPRTYILVTEYDVVRDDGLLYAERLEEARVAVKLKFVWSQSHFFLAPTLPFDWLKFSSADETWSDIYQFIWRTL